MNALEVTLAVCVVLIFAAALWAAVVQLWKDSRNDGSKNKAEPTVSSNVNATNEIV